MNPSAYMEAHACNRRDVDDGAALAIGLELRLHHWKHMLATEKCRLQVTIDLAVPIFFGEADRIARETASHIVHKNVDTAVNGNAPFHCALNLRGARHVRLVRSPMCMTLICHDPAGAI